MEEMASLWCYQESVDELKQRLLCSSLELESVKMEANEELRKSKEKMTHLIQALNLAYKERDEAKTQYRNLLNKLIISNTNNSTITDSSNNSPSETLNNYPVSVSSSPDLISAVHIPDSSTIHHHLSIPSSPIDPDCLRIESIVEGKVLPQKGKLLKAVLEAGPLLQTLLVAGPLPQWRNPPPVQQTFVVPTVGFEKGGSVVRSFVEMSCGGASSSSQILLSASKSTMNFGDGGGSSSRSCLVGGKLVGAGENNLNINDYGQMGVKRQRIW
ncbi:uncharacterized protein LOC124915584 [Impatiens glandulifera]|uniref:uncharacterized protein LOC124915584 n=1 Tax=Impatiens glandulifera TaxID=253017 RepID=UPI001FB12027|nr:uncharacterized protein LOC124915584 [Impatiens glandulifera]